MKVKRTSILTDITRTLEIPLTEQEYKEGYEKINSGTLIQHVFPQLSDDHREFLLSGITPEEWEEAFPPEEEEI